MSKIIFPNGNGITVFTPSSDYGDISIEQLAVKITPNGVPFLIVDASDIPTDRSQRGQWTADFSNPHGYGGAT